MTGPVPVRSRIASGAAAALVTLLLCGAGTAGASAGPVVSGAVAVTGPAVADSAVSAVPADRGVEVSLDGTHFVRETADPLFPDPPLIVPGDVVVATLWVRNATPYAGALRVSGGDARASSPALAQALGVTAREAGAAGTSGIAFTAAAECALLLDGPVLAPGEQTSLQLALTFDAATPGREGAGAQANLDFVVTLRDPADPGASGTADCSGGGVVPAFPDGGGGGAGGSGASEGIALTGQDVLPTIVFGAGFLVAGLLTVLAYARANRRRRDGRPRP